jgi:hypothetical protein
MTTGSTVQGLVQGMANGLGGAGVSGLDIGTIINVDGSPDGVVQAFMQYQVAWDGRNSQAYQSLAAGSSWVKLGSVA